MTLHLSARFPMCCLLTLPILILPWSVNILLLAENLTMFKGSYNPVCQHFVQHLDLSKLHLFQRNVSTQVADSASTLRMIANHFQNCSLMFSSFNQQHWFDRSHSGSGFFWFKQKSKLDLLSSDHANFRCRWKRKTALSWCVICLVDFLQISSPYRTSSGTLSQPRSGPITSFNNVPMVRPLSLRHRGPWPEVNVNMMCIHK